MSRLSRTLNKPYYLFRPIQVLHRLQCMRSTSLSREFANFRLPWGHLIRCRPADAIGNSIMRTGIYDLCLTETLWRLLDGGDYAIDVGANIGYMTSLMAARIGQGGQVYALEPHPEVFNELKHNTDEWNRLECSAPIEVFEVAASDRTGIGHLACPQQFDKNRGTSFVTIGGPVESIALHTIKLQRLDEMGIGDQTISLMKLDVEGHELSVLRGGMNLLATRCVRDIIFEDHNPAPTPPMQLLQSCGFTLFRLDANVLGVTLSTPTDCTTSSSFEPVSYLATRDRQRALERLRPRGWRALKGYRS